MCTTQEGKKTLFSSFGVQDSFVAFPSLHTINELCVVCQKNELGAEGTVSPFIIKAFFFLGSSPSLPLIPPSLLLSSFSFICVDLSTANQGKKKRASYLLSAKGERGGEGNYGLTSAVGRGTRLSFSFPSPQRQSPVLSFMLLFRKAEKKRSSGERGGRRPPPHLASRAGVVRWQVESYSRSLSFSCLYRELKIYSILFQN